MLVNVAVYRTTPPGATDPTSALLLIVSCATFTVAVQSGSVPPLTGQLPPAVVEVTVLASVLSPVSGVCTVTE